MLRTRTDFWGAAFISSLGLSALGCGGGEGTSDSEVAASEDDDPANEDSSDDDDSPSDDDGANDDDADDESGDDSANDDDSAGDDDVVEVPNIPALPGPTTTSVVPTTQNPAPTRPPGSGGAPVSAAGAAGAGGQPMVGPAAGAGGVDNPPAGGESGGPAAGGSGTGPVTPESCANSKPVLNATVTTGLEICDSGVVHRPAPLECANNLVGRAAAGMAPPVDDQGLVAPGECQTDADCTAEPYGQCKTLGQAGIPTCVYGCTEDADCGEDQLCVCGPEIGACVAATCQSDADCGEGFLCAEYVHHVGVGCGEPAQYACQTEDDACATDQDCIDAGTGDNCAVVDGARACLTTPGVACGRPFLVGGQAVLAEARFGARRSDPSAPDSALSAREREALAAHWTAIGLMEHASIAAFARFCLQLLAVGAPSDLLEGAQAAMADEAAHTELAFDLAGRYAGLEVSAGPLPVDPAALDAALETILCLAIEEGCVGETVAALEAVEARAHCTDAAVARVLERIAHDERNHAALAWRFVAWAIDQNPTLAEVAQREFERIASQAAHDPANATLSALDLRAHGALPEAVRAEVRAAAIRDVVLPCARGLFAARSFAAEPVLAVA